MYHKAEHHTTTNDDVAEASTLLTVVEPELYATFLNFQESLMRPYTSAGNVFSDSMYEKMLPIAAQLTSAAATLAAAELGHKSDD